MSWAKRLKRVFNIESQGKGSYERRPKNRLGPKAALLGAPCGWTSRPVSIAPGRSPAKTLLDYLEKNTAQTPARRALPPAADAPPQAIHPGLTD